MAKIAFSKLNQVKTMGFKVAKVNGVEIEVAQYLPLEEKLMLIQTVLELALEDKGFFNPMKVRTFLDLEILKQYTNISFTEKQMENLQKLYDSLVINGIIREVKTAMSEEELCYLEKSVFECGESIVKHNNSVMGILQSMSEKYDTSALDMHKIIEMIKDPQQLEFVKNILTQNL